MAASLDVQIPAAEREIGDIRHGSVSAAKLLFDEVKLIRQLGSKHLLVKSVERLQEDKLVRRFQFIELLLVFAFGIQGSNFSELAGKGMSVCRAWFVSSLHGYNLCVVCSIGRLGLFDLCDIQGKPGVQSFKSDLDTAVRRLTFF